MKLKLSQHERYARAHNYFSCRHGHPALKWNHGLAESAHAWVQTCPLVNGNPSHLRPNGTTSLDLKPRRAENVAAGARSPEDVVKSWYSEITQPGCEPDTKCPEASRYTAMIWKATGALGCAKSPCQKGEPHPAHVCHYGSAPPNYGDKSEYVKNVPQSSTPTVDEDTCCKEIYGSAKPRIRPRGSEKGRKGGKGRKRAEGGGGGGPGGPHVPASIPLTPYGTTGFCKSLLYQDEPVCADGRPVDALSRCCGNKKCPPSCLTASISTNDGNTTCQCTKCTIGIKLKLSQRERYIAAHNYFRCRHGHPALKWNHDLAESAHAWVQTCPLVSGRPAHLRPNGTTSVNLVPRRAENVAAGQNTPEDAVEAWYRGVTNPGCKPGTTCPEAGRYTAMIWKATGALGCAENPCKIGAPHPAHVCHYGSAPPNYGAISEYVKNVPQSSTPTMAEDTCCKEIYGSAQPRLVPSPRGSEKGRRGGKGRKRAEERGGPGGPLVPAHTSALSTPVSAQASQSTTGFCKSQLYQDEPVCADGRPVDALSRCCEHGKCPPSCLIAISTNNGNGNMTCQCTKCTLGIKLKLSLHERYVRAHNYFRCRHGHPALKWNYDLAESAQAWVQTCPFVGRHPAHLRPNGTTSFDLDPMRAENVAAGPRSPEDAVESWYSEITQPGCKPGTECIEAGRYTAIIWKAIGALGCAENPCKKGAPHPAHVCHYGSAPPNYGDKSDYIDNLPQSSTPTVDEDTCCKEIYGSAQPRRRSVGPVPAPTSAPSATASVQRPRGEEDNASRRRRYTGSGPPGRHFYPSDPHPSEEGSTGSGPHGRHSYSSDRPPSEEGSTESGPPRRHFYPSDRHPSEEGSADSGPPRRHSYSSVRPPSEEGSTDSGPLRRHSYSSDRPPSEEGYFRRRPPRRPFYPGDPLRAKKATLEDAFTRAFALRAKKAAQTADHQEDLFSQAVAPEAIQSDSGEADGQDEETEEESGEVEKEEYRSRLETEDNLAGRQKKRATEEERERVEEREEETR